jgi:hypothetical protein
MSTKENWQAANGGTRALGKHAGFQSQAHLWDEIGEQAKDRFLVRYGFKTGWGSHTWKTLPREIQAAFESFTPLFHHEAN